MSASTRGVVERVSGFATARSGDERWIVNSAAPRAANYFRRAASDANRHGRARGERCAVPNARFVVVGGAKPFERGAGRRGVGLR